MDPVERRTARWVLAVLGAVWLLGEAAALVRLLPWLLAPQVSWGVVGRFAWGLALLNLEVAVVVALPLGAALAGASWQDRGEGRALLLSGASPWRLAARTWWMGVLVAALGWGAGELAQQEAARPGIAALSWIQGAREGCDGHQRRISEVPGTGMSWLCEARQAPWLVFAVGGSVVQTRRLQASVGGRWEMEDVRWSLRGPPQLELSTRFASLDAGPVRGGDRPRPFLALGAWLGAWMLGGALLASGEGRRWIAVALGVTCAGLLLTLQGECDGGRLGAWWLAAQPALALGPGFLWWGLRRRRFLLG